MTSESETYTIVSSVIKQYYHSTSKEVITQVVKNLHKDAPFRFVRGGLWKYFGGITLAELATIDIMTQLGRESELPPK
jgi:hypothetical protein